MLVASLKIPLDIMSVEKQIDWGVCEIAGLVDMIIVIFDAGAAFTYFSAHGNDIGTLQGLHSQKIIERVNHAHVPVLTFEV
jgi:hypothetical protein